jgi:hypothetical protein
MIFEQIISYLARLLTRLVGIRKDLKSILDLLQRILTAVEPSPAVGFEFDVEIEGELQIGVEMADITNSQKFTVSAKPVNARGGPAAIDGVPTWAVSDATILSVTPASDGLSAAVAAVGPTGTADVSVSGDADLGEGVKPIFGKLTVNVTPGAAVGFELTAGAPEEQ